MADATRADADRLGEVFGDALDDAFLARYGDRFAVVSGDADEPRTTRVHRLEYGANRIVDTDLGPARIDVTFEGVFGIERACVEGVSDRSFREGAEWAVELIDDDHAAEAFAAHRGDSVADAIGRVHADRWSQGECADGFVEDSFEESHDFAPSLAGVKDRETMVQSLGQDALMGDFSIPALASSRRSCSVG